MKIRTTNTQCVALALLAAFAAPAATQGLYVGPYDPRPLPAPPVRDDLPRPAPVRPLPAIEFGLLQVRATIQDGVAATEVEQTFRNQTGAVQEGTWILPLPPGAVADRFTLTVNGSEQRGEVLDAASAQRIYLDIVRREQDPGLLEYLGQGCLKARVFPIPAQGEVLVKVRFVQQLPQSGTFREWRYPLRAAFIGGQGPSRLTVSAQIHSQSPLRSLHTPNAGLEIERLGEHRARASLAIEGGQVPPADLQLLYGVSTEDFGVNVLTHRAPGQDGTFMLLISPKQDWPQQLQLRRAITLVLDTSGSMAGEKIEQARGAARTFLSSLHAEDLFNVISFSNEAQPFFEAPRPASPENLQPALQRVAGLKAVGGTNIEEALQRALGQPLPHVAGLVPITVFLTDGLPTVGTTDVDALLAKVDAANRHGSRVFAFGVGHDVNTRFLDTLVERARGALDYVLPGEDIEVKTGALFAKLSGPVMTGVEVLCEGIEGHGIQPRRTPDLFVGSTLTLVGRYRGHGQHAVILRGRVGGELREQRHPASFPQIELRNDWLPALWAQKTVAFLMDQVRVNGPLPELIAEITRLGKEHGIVTPYTSHLIVEEGLQLAQQRGLRRLEGSDEFFLGANGAEAGERLRRELTQAGKAAPGGPATPGPGIAGRTQSEAERSRREAADQSEVGSLAVGKSLAQKQLAAEAGIEGQGRGSSIALTHQRIGAKQFHLLGGVWVDRDWREELKDRRQKVPAFSDAWFALLEQRPQLARYLAFSTRILVVDGDAAFEIE